ncbi:unnamed protein product [Dicrocoelium dendriticum]|nr:unnamed protein product [Dicrocoelium dendriticum]
MYCTSPPVRVSLTRVGNQEADPTTAQFVLLTSMQKLDQARRSRGGIKLRRGLLIAVTALKAKQMLWERDLHIHSSNLMVSGCQSLADNSGLVADGPQNPQDSLFRSTTISNPVWPAQGDLTCETTQVNEAITPMPTTDIQTLSSPSTFPDIDYVFPPIDQLCYAFSEIGSSRFENSSCIPCAESSDAHPSEDLLPTHSLKRSCLDELLLPDSNCTSNDSHITNSTFQPLLPELKRPCLEIG